MNVPVVVNKNTIQTQENEGYAAVFTDLKGSKGKKMIGHKKSKSKEKLVTNVNDLVDESFERKPTKKGREKSANKKEFNTVVANSQGGRSNSTKYAYVQKKSSEFKAKK